MQLQFRCDKWTFLLDGRVFEAFYPGTDITHRYHVDHMTIEAKPTSDGQRIRFGYLVSGSLFGGGKLDVPTERTPEFEAFVKAALAARTPA